MKHLFIHTLTLLAVSALLATEGNAQQFNKRKQYSSVGVSLNAMNYLGDIVPKESLGSLRFAATRPNIGINFMHRFAPRFSVRAALSYGRITGDDEKAANPDDANAKYRYNRNMAFRNDIFELSAVGVLDLLDNRNNYVRRPDFVPYIFGGVAFFHHNPKGLVKANNLGLTQGSYVDLQPLQTEGVNYSKAQFAIPFGLGVRYKVSRNFDLALEVGIRKTFTDYLDDVSSNFIDRSQLTTPAAQYFGSDVTRSTSGEFASFKSPGQMRGKSNEKDWYAVSGLTLNYILSPRIKSPKFR